MKKVLWSLIAAFVLTVILLPQKAQAATPDDYELVKIDSTAYNEFDITSIPTLTVDEVDELLIWAHLESANDEFYYIPFAFENGYLKCRYYYSGSFQTINMSTQSMTATAGEIMEENRKTVRDKGQNAEFFKAIGRAQGSTSATVNGTSVEAYLVRTMGKKEAHRNISGYMNTENSKLSFTDNIEAQASEVVEGQFSFNNMSKLATDGNTDHVVFIIPLRTVDGYQLGHIENTAGSGLPGSYKILNTAPVSAQITITPGKASTEDRGWAISYTVRYITSIHVENLPEKLELGDSLSTAVTLSNPVGLRVNEYNNWWVLDSKGEWISTKSVSRAGKYRFGLAVDGEGDLTFDYSDGNGPSKEWKEERCRFIASIITPKPDKVEYIAGRGNAGNMVSWYKIYYDYELKGPQASGSETESREEVEETPGPTKEELDVQKVTQYGDTAAVIPGGITQATIKVGGNEITLDTSGVTTKTPTTSYVSAPPKTDPVGQTLTAFANLLNGGQCLSMTRYQLFTSGKPVIGNYGTVTVDMQITSASEGQEVLVVIWGPDGGVRYEKVKVTNGKIPVLLAEHSYVAVYALNQGQLKK